MFNAVETVYCLGLFPDPTTVIGNNILQSQSVVFDLEKKEFGVAKANISFHSFIVLKFLYPTVLVIQQLKDKISKTLQKHI